MIRKVYKEAEELNIPEAKGIALGLIGPRKEKCPLNISVMRSPSPFQQSNQGIEWQNSDYRGMRSGSVCGICVWI